MAAAKRTRTIKKLSAPKPLTFEEAMKALRRGKSIRRRGWHIDSKIFRLGQDVFVKLPKSIAEAPSVWKPYSKDFLATDWAVIR